MKLSTPIRSLAPFSLLLALSLSVPACGSDEDDEGASAGADCDPDNEEACAEGLTCTESDGEDEAVCLIDEGSACEPDEEFCVDNLTCVETVDDEYRCFARVVLRGNVSDTTDSSSISGAHVLALDEEGSAVTDISVSDADGGYLLDIPVIRNKDGSPVDSNFTLNGAAQDYQPFPSGVRVALPINAEDAEREGDLYIIENALTDIGLIHLGDGERVTASGSVGALSNDSNVAGLLVVVTGSAGTFTAVTDLSGSFTVFNLPEGEYEVRAYGAGVQVDSETLTVSDKSVTDLALAESSKATTKVSGNIQIVNAPGGALTSVILVLEDTFNEEAARGEVPRGLRAPSSGPVSIAGDFSIEGVPDGKYVVLAAYENDDLVRDPDTNISGTGFVHIEVDSSDDENLDISESFKVTEALGIVGPGTDGPEEVSDKPKLEWVDDSSEDWYDVHVFDAFGDEVWSSIEIPGVSGSGNVSVQYEGPLDPGMYYQFRVVSWRQPGKGDPAPISTSEDLRGVFFLPADE